MPYILAMTLFWVFGIAGTIAWLIGKWGDRIQQKRQRERDAEYHRTHPFFR
jgi:hypothetical protein